MLARLPLLLFVAAAGCDAPDTSVDDENAIVRADDIPVAHTPGCGWETFPPPVLAACTEPLVDDAPDLRGLWEGYAGDAIGHVERVEQCGDRVVITGGGVVHDMRADGTLENGVNDVAAATCGEIQVAAAFVDGRLELSPFGEGVLVTRELVGDDMLWNYLNMSTTLRRIEDLPDAD